LLLWLAVLTVPVQAEYLQGGVQHSEYLPQMPPQLQAGNAYQDQAGKEQPTTVVWYPLPKWLAGKYESKFITNQVTEVYSSAALPHGQSGKMKHIESYGLQEDNKGRVWHADFLPSTSLWEGARKEVQTTVEKQCMVTNDEKLVLRIHNHCVYLKPGTKRILYSEQVEGYKTITLQNRDGDLAIWDDIQEYDPSGKPLERYIARSTMHRIEKFKPTDSKNGIDLSKSLAQYLASIKRFDLISGSAPPSAPESNETRSPNTVPKQLSDDLQVGF